MSCPAPDTASEAAAGFGWLRRRRRILERWLAERDLSHTVSLAVYQLHLVLRSVIAEHARGRCLDAGSGRAPFGRFLRGRGLEVCRVDVERRGPGVDVVADVQEMPEIASGSMQTVLCTQVLEHLPRPGDALGEFHRVLEPGGVLILSAPHLSVIHEPPNDFYRFTRFGLEQLLKRRDLDVESVAESGGLVSFLAHGASAGLLSSLGAVPGMRRVTWLLNYLLLVRALAPVDRLLGLRRTYPCNYVVVARKKS